MIEPKDCYLTQSCKKYTSGRCSLDEAFCVKLIKIDSILTQANLTDKQKQPIVLTALDKDIESFITLKAYEDNIVNMVEHGVNLYICSNNTGNGKTSWAVRLLTAYVKNLWYKMDTECQCLFINIPKLFIALKNFNTVDEYAQHIMNNVYNVPLVVWDDVGTKGLTDFEKEHLFNLVESRLVNGKSNIYTSNVTDVAVLSNLLGDRLTSRIYSSQIVELYENDKRNVRFVE